MIRIKFEPWVRRAISRILLPQDRIDAERELMNHMEDRYHDLVGDSVAPEQAVRQTIAAMGDADEVAVELGAIHRPFWGRMQMVSARILHVTAVLTLLCLAGFITARLFFVGGYDQAVYYRYDPYGMDYAFDNAGEMHRRLYSAPMVTAWSDGYCFTVSDAAQWQEVGTDGSVTDRFYFRVQVRNPLPWAEYGDILRWFWAEDSLGNRYSAAYETGSAKVPSVQGSCYHAGPLTWNHDMYLSDFVSADAQWIDLHYNRAGRDLVLRIQLEGGAV